MRTMFVMLAMAMLAMTGCASRKAFHPPLVEEQVIQNYAQYAEAMAKEREAFEALRTEKDQAAVFVVRELGKLPSEVSRRYAVALGDVLKRHGVRGVGRVNVAAGTKTVSYEELAKVAALTSMLYETGTGWEDEVPLEMWRKMAHAVVMSCPCDDAALTIVGWSWMFSMYRGKSLPDSAARREWKDVFRAIQKRVADENRPMNLTTIQAAFVMPQMYAGYVLMIDDPNGHDTKDFLDAVTKAGERAAQYELPEEMRKDYEEFRSRPHKEPEVWKTWVSDMDVKLMQIYPATTAMKVFCEAVNRRDEKTVRESVTEYVLKENENVFTTILGEGYDRIACDYVGLMDNDREDGSSKWVMRGVVSGRKGSSVVFMGLMPTKDGKLWKVTEIQRVEERGAED